MDMFDADTYMELTTNVLSSARDSIQREETGAFSPSAWLPTPHRSSQPPRKPVSRYITWSIYLLVDAVDEKDGGLLVLFLPSEGQLCRLRAPPPSEELRTRTDTLEVGILQKKGDNQPYFALLDPHNASLIQGIGRGYKDTISLISEKGTSYVSSNESMKSCGKVRDIRITDLEEKLALAEDRCSVLRNQVAYMKMLYTNNNSMRVRTAEEEETLKAGGEYKKIEENIKNSISNPFSYRAEAEDFKRMPANMTVKPLGGTTLTKDPKEAMQMIVNEMTQSVNAMEGGINIHSNLIEGVMLSSRNRKKRPNKREEWSTPKTKKTPMATAQQRETNKKLVNRTREREPDLKSLGSKSKASVNSMKTVKKRPNSKFNAGLRPRAVSRKYQEIQEVKDKPRKAVLHKAGSDATMAKVASSTYLLPTLSYRMKCVPKSHRREYSFHRIPFVLGKSINKSHNLGAKIQETLSMIKLSRKGLQSSSLCKKEELNNLLHNTSADLNGVPQPEPRTTMSSQSKIRPPPLTPGATSDYKNYQLRTVLMNLHDEFSKMTETYESLKASLKGKFDPEVAQRIQNLEEDLNAKEIEINAFMNLYNEVSQLKDKLSSAQSGYPPNSMYRPASCYTESTSTLKMTRLLRRIEQFQNQLKTMSYI